MGNDEEVEGRQDSMRHWPRSIQEYETWKCLSVPYKTLKRENMAAENERNSIALCSVSEASWKVWRHNQDEGSKYF